MAETTGRQQGGRWPKGVSGNAAGRPLGARHKVTLAIEALLEGDAERLGRKAIEMALAGDTVALRLCLERIAPARKSSPVEVDLPPIASVADMPLTLSAVRFRLTRLRLLPASLRCAGRPSRRSSSKRGFGRLKQTQSAH
jgi:hypothetical protein